LVSLAGVRVPESCGLRHGSHKFAHALHQILRFAVLRNLIYHRAAASSPRTLKISSATGSGTTKVSASEETHSINPALASKMTGKALMTRGSDIFQFFSQFFGSILKWRDVVPQQQVEKFRARDA
jgi:hypothetical protein